MKKIVLLISLTILNFGVVLQANAATYLDGTLSLSGGFVSASLGDVVSTLTLFDVNSAATIVAGTNDFAGLAGATAEDINTLAPAGLIFSVGGFDFTLVSISGFLADPLTCGKKGPCVDGVSFSVSGSVEGNGFGATEFSGLWDADGSCFVAGGSCDSGKIASWDVLLTANGVAAGSVGAVSEPASLVLLAFGLMGVARRLPVKV